MSNSFVSFVYTELLYLCNLFVKGFKKILFSLVYLNFKALVCLVYFSYIDFNLVLS